MLPLKQENGRPVRIVHVTSAHSAFDVRIFCKECQSLARASYEVIVLANYKGDTVSAGVRIRGLGQSRGRGHRLLKLARMVWEAMRLNADVYHIHDPELLLLPLVLRVLGKKTIYDIHEDLPRTIRQKHYLPRLLRWPLMWLVEGLENMAASCMSGLVAATPVIGERFRRVNRHTAIVQNYAILDELGPPAHSNWSSRDMKVAYIGGISEERGIYELLGALSLLPASLGIKLELAGRFYSAEVEQRVSRDVGWKRVNWRGLLDRGEVRDLLGRVRAGMLVLHPEENFLVSQPVKLFEYMAAGIPVIASDFPLWRSIVMDARCGLMVNPNDPGGIARAIEYLLTHDDEAAAMGQRGRLAVVERYNWEREERTFLEFYRSLLDPAADAIPAVKQTC